jgi:hypothetical protein
MGKARTLYVVELCGALHAEKRSAREGHVKEKSSFWVPKFISWQATNTHSDARNSTLKITLHQNVHTLAQGYSRSLRSLRSQIICTRTCAGSSLSTSSLFGLLLPVPMFMLVGHTSANSSAAGRWLSPLLFLAAGTGGAAGFSAARGGPTASLLSCDGFTFAVPVPSSSLSPRPPFLPRRQRGSPSPFLPCVSPWRKLSASSSSSGEPDSTSARSNKSKSRAALRHVLEDVCRFDEGSTALTVFRRGGMSSISDLCDMTDEEAADWVLREGGGTGRGSTGLPTPEQMIEIKKIKTLKMWRSHLRRERGGISPKDDDWLMLTSDDFEEFRALVHEALPPSAAGTGRFSIEAAAQVARDFVKSVMDRQPEPIKGSDGMLVMKDVVKLETGVKADVVIRKVTRPFWQACIDAVDPPLDDVLVRRGRSSAPPTPTRQQLRVCAVGTPGIGKTTCTPLLIKMLLEQKKAVVYRVRSEDNDEWIYEFIPGSGDGDPVAANVYPAQAFSSGIPSLSEASTFYVVDPGLFKGSCNPSVNFLPKVIIVASPDSTHWGGNEFYKERDGLEGVLKFFPVWELGELLQARLVLGSTVTAGEVEDRYGRVGGVPRHIFASDTSFEDALRRQDTAVKLLTAQQVKAVSVKFAVEAIVEDTFEPSQPKSALIGYRISADDKGAFSIYQVEVIRRFMMDMWQDLLLPSASNPWLFEIYTRYLIASKSTTFTCRVGVGKRGPGRSTIERMALGGGCKEVRLVGDIVAAARKRKMVVYHSIKLSNQLIDFLYQDSDGRFHAFHATLAKTHTANVSELLQLEERVGGPTKLSLYYLVPESRFEDFVTEPVDPRNPPDKEGATCNVYHVSISDPNSTEEEREEQLH